MCRSPDRVARRRTPADEYTFAAALPGPVSGEHSVEVLDLRVRPSRVTAFNGMVGLVGWEHGDGSFLENNAFEDEVRQVHYTVAGRVIRLPR